jgi:Holliday junction DNA helicase RuvA
MIGKLYGIVDEILNDFVLLNVNGVCYQVYCSSKSLGKMNKDDSVQLFIETHVREDQITLFGFLTQSEKNSYAKLVTVKGVGPKMALAILSSIKVSDLVMAIASGDKAAFSSVSGVGPKLAVRLINELKDKDFEVSGEISTNITQAVDLAENNETLDSAVSALINLGLSRSDAYSRSLKILNSDPEISLSDLIRKSLKEISK